MSGSRLYPGAWTVGDPEGAHGIVVAGWVGHALTLGLVWPVIKGRNDTHVLLVPRDSIPGSSGHDT